MNRLRRRGDGWLEAGNPRRSVLLLGVSVLYLGVAVVLVALVPSLWTDGERLLAVGALLGALLNAGNALLSGREARDEWRGYR